MKITTTFKITAILSICSASIFELTEFIQAPQNPIYIMSRSPVDVTCSAKFATEISFKCNGKLLPKNRFVETQTTDDKGVQIATGTLTVQRKQVVEYFGPEDYWCICLARSSKTNEWEKTKKIFIHEAYLEQRFQKPLPQSGGVKYGEKFVLDCRPPRGIPRPEVTWLKDGKILDIDSINYETTDKGDLIVNKVDQSASGNYTCRAENIVGVRETPTASVFVWVNGQWSSWSEWSSCKIKDDCGWGSRDRSRRCNNPSPIVPGKSCRGSKIRYDRCMVPCKNARIIENDYEPITEEPENEDSRLILIASLAGAAGLALVIFVVIFVYFRSRRNYGYYSKDIKKAPFSANHDFDLIRAPSQVDARGSSQPEYSSICNRKEGMEQLEQLLYRPESSFANSMKPTGYSNTGHNFPVKLEPYSEEFGTRSSSGVSTDRTDVGQPDIVNQHTHLPVRTGQTGPTASTPQRGHVTIPGQFHPSYPSFSYPNPYQPR